MLKKIKETVQYMKSKADFVPDAGIVLGTGLGGLVNEIETKYSFDYHSIPNFPISTVEGHSGRLILGKLGNKNVIAMQGRFHFYEGYSMQEVTFPIRVMKSLGIRSLILSNASGGLNPDFKVGDLMILTDHINLFPDNPLRGKNYGTLGPRFPDMSQVYDNYIVELAKKIARSNKIETKEGIYIGVSGPTFETPAEYKYLRKIGGDAVGMSTVPEVIVARHADIPCFAISVITDSGVPGQIVEVTHEEIQEIASKVEPKLTLIVRELLNTLEL